MTYQQKQKGFTIVELMVATIAFSGVLLLCLAGLTQIGRMYRKGITTTTTQSTTRAVLDEIAQSIQLSGLSVTKTLTLAGPDVPLPVPVGNGLVYKYKESDTATGQNASYFCIDKTRYTYAIDRQQVAGTPDASKKQIRHALWVDVPPSGCVGTIFDSATLPLPDLSAEPPTPNGKDLLSANMRLTRLNVTPIKGDDLWRIEITVLNGDEDVMITENNRKTCMSSLVGTEFCAISELSLIVKRRVI